MIKILFFTLIKIYLFSILFLGCAGDSPISSTSEQIYLKKIISINGKIHYTCGTKGQLFKLNTNSLWQKINLNTEQTLLDIFFINDKIGFIASEKGIIFKSTDNGENWKSIQIQSNQSFKSISFIDENIGIIAGTNGRIFKTKDGGNNWEDKSFVEGVFWETIKLYTDGSGFVGGSKDNNYDSGIIYYTNDYGDNWTEVDISNYEMKGITKIRETNFGLLLISSNKVIFTPIENNRRFFEFIQIFDINTQTNIDSTFFVSDLIFTDQDNNNIDSLTNNFVVIGYRGHNLGNILINNNFTITNNLLNYYLLDGITEILDNDKEFSINNLKFVGGYGYKLLDISGKVIELN